MKKKLSQRVKDLKEWSLNNADKIAVGVTGVVVLGTAIARYKLGKIDIPQMDIDLKGIGEDTSVGTLVMNGLELINAGEIGKEILRQHPELNPDTLVDLSIVYTPDEFCEWGLN